MDMTVEFSPKLKDYRAPRLTLSIGPGIDNPELIEGVVTLTPRLQGPREVAILGLEMQDDRPTLVVAAGPARDGLADSVVIDLTTGQVTQQQVVTCGACAVETATTSCRECGTTLCAKCAHTVGAHDLCPDCFDREVRYA